MSRALALVVLLAILCSGFVGYRSTIGNETGQRPNVLLILIDTLRADRLAAYGYERETAPAITDLARGGVVMENAVCSASFTMPSMASILSSRYPFQHGVRFHPTLFRDEETTLAEIFQDSGYATGAVVSNMLLSRRWGFDQGFDYFDAIRESPLGEAGGLFLYDSLRKLQRGERAVATAESAVRWMERHRDDPFFLWVHFIDPHFPYIPPPPFDSRFSDPPSTEYREILRNISIGTLPRSELVFDTDLSPAVAEDGKDQYDGEIAFTDVGVRRLTDALDRLGLAENTIVILTSDHGESLGDHGVNFAHAFTTYEEMMRVPLVIRAPADLDAGERIGEPIDLLDLSPTILEFAGLRAADSMEGESFLGLLRTGRRNGKVRPSYGENVPRIPGHPTYSLISGFPGIHENGIAGKWRMVRRYPWKLIHIPGRPEGENLLFHLESDPREEEDLARAHPEELRLLLDHLDRFLENESGDGAEAGEKVSNEELDKLRALGYVQ